MALDKLITLSEGDRDTLRALVADWLRTNFGSTQRPYGGDYWDEHQAPEVYVAKTPSGGIPALSGTDPVEPGFAFCDLYHIVFTGSETVGTADDVHELVKIGTLSHRIYNLSTTALDANAWVLAVRDKHGEWFAVSAGGGGDGADRFVKCIEADGLPDGAGLYDGRLQTENADGTLSDTGASVWMQDAFPNFLPRLNYLEIYHCRKTGNTNGRDVYTLSDSTTLTVQNESGSQASYRTTYLYCYPDRTWTVQAPDSRLAFINRILNVKETGGTNYTDVFQFIFDPANAWVVTESAGEVTIQRTLQVFEGTIQWGGDNIYRMEFRNADFNLSSPGDGQVNIETDGATQSLYLLECCTGGQLKARLFDFERGLCDNIGPRINDPECPVSDVELSGTGTGS